MRTEHARRGRRPRTASARRPAEALEPRTFLSAGDLDAAFDFDGVAFPGPFDYPSVASATATAVAPDGKLIVTGVARGPASDAAVVARFNPDGSPDPTFDFDGRVVLPDVRARDTGNAGAAAVQADGKVIIAAGRTLLRLNADGSLDQTFGVGGIASYGAGPLDNDITEIAIQPDGNIIVGAASTYLRLVRVVADNDPGTRDGFTDERWNGATSTLLNLPGPSQLNDLAVLPNGKIVAALTTTVGAGNQEGVLVRINANGTIDNSFSDDAIAEYTVPAFGSADVTHTTALAVQGLPDGRIAAGGTTTGGFYVARFRVDGRTDPTFGTGGFVFTPHPAPGPNESPPVYREMEFATDGKLLAAGPAPESSAPPVIVVRRFLAEGTPDLSFGTAGEARTPPGGQPRAMDLAVAGDGSVAVAVSGPTNGAKQFAAVRLDSQGQAAHVVSTTFKIPGDEAQFNSVAEAAGGRLVAGGILGLNSVLARFNSDGSLDTTFGTDGFTVISIPGFNRTDVRELLVRPDGKIVAGGTVSNQSGQFFVGRFNADGTPDTTFSGDGYVTTSLGPNTGVWVGDITIDSAGRVIAAGAFRSGSGSYQFTAARYLDNGSPDLSFDGDGVVITNVGTDSDQANTVTILSDGGILLGGDALNAVNPLEFAAAFVKYRPDGSLDPTFGNQPGDPGVAIHGLTNRGQIIWDVLPREGGGFFATGYLSFVRPGETTVRSDFGVAAFTANGSLDTTFGGGDGIATAGFADEAGVTDAVAIRLARQSDGKLVLAGQVDTGSGVRDFALARFTASGEPDPTFGGDGRVTTDLLLTDSTTAMALLSDGRIVLAGLVQPPIPSGSRAVLLRYTGDASPAAAELYVRGSAWTAEFQSYMEARGLGDDVMGYRVDNLAGNGAVIPWVNADEIVVRYSAPPAAGGAPAPGNASVDGVRSDYTVTGVTALDPQTFVLRLDRPLGNLPRGGENGDRITLSVPGGPGGGPLRQTIDVLQGDANRSGSVIADDFSDVKKKLFRTTAQPGPAGDTQYTVFHDVDGSGAILADDYSEVKKRFFDTLPPPPTVSTAVASITAEVLTAATPRNR